MKELAVKRPRKAMVIGLDGAVPKHVLKFVAEGRLPTIAKLIREGVFAENCLSCFPTSTPENWTTIATGATVGTHGITGFEVHHAGKPLDDLHPGWCSRDNRAEYIWEAAERAGKRSIVVNYPASWPPRMKMGVQIGGAGVGVCEWRVHPSGEIGGMKFSPYLCTISDNLLFSTEEHPLASRIEVKAASGWKNLPDPFGALEAELKLTYSRTLEKVKGKTWYLSIRDTGGKGYDRVSLCRSKDAEDEIGSAGVGEWGKRAVEVFETATGPKKGFFKFKLMELSKDGKRLKLYFTPISQVDGWSYPKEVARELRDIEGIPLTCGPFRAMAGWIDDKRTRLMGGDMLQWIDDETFVEMMGFEMTWLVQATKYLLRRYDWNLFFMHDHIPDQANHLYMNRLEPSTERDERTRKRYERLMGRLYEIIDRGIRRIIEMADEDTLIIVVSDHGGIPFLGDDPVPKVLSDMGLMVAGDWKKTRAYAQRWGYIYVNLKGRDPDGIVEPEEYEGLRDGIIKGLYGYVSPSGKRPVALALRREDARILGLHGDRIGDIVYALDRGFGGTHGQLPTCAYGVGDMRCLLIISGLGFKKNYKLKRTVWTTDIVPTICHLLDIPVPKHCEGAIMYQALERM